MRLPGQAIEGVYLRCFALLETGLAEGNELVGVQRVILLGISWVSWARLG